MTRSSRYEGDRWDLGSGVGATATRAAVRRALAAKDPRGLITDPFAEPLVKALGIDAFTRLVDGEIEFPDAGPTFTSQQMAEAIAVRARYFDGFFTDAVAAGLRQAVILAPGLDTRTYRLPWPTGTVVYEVDLPQVIEFRTRTLAELGAIPTAERRPVGIDLRDDWLTALRRKGFDDSQPTAWSAEGLLVYLPPDAQDRLFDNITTLSVRGSRVVTDYVPDMSAYTNQRVKAVTDRIAERWRRCGQSLDMTELFYYGERSDVVEYLAARGWQTLTRTIPELYAANDFECPGRETPVMFAGVEYVSATLA